MMQQFTPQKFTLTIQSGKNRFGEQEGFESIEIRPGDTLSIVGPTGSGKSALINDIENLAQGDSVTGRRILINGEEPPESFVREPAFKPISLITQNTRCLADLSVEAFMLMHIRARRPGREDLLDETINLANTFTGEEISLKSRMSGLSGGQTRALMIADALVIGDTPILLLDEIENAGIFKDRVIQSLQGGNKAVILVTHDPYLALTASRRIVMKHGGVSSVIEPTGQEQHLIEDLAIVEDRLHQIREKIRMGAAFSSDSSKVLMTAAAQGLQLNRV
ncbi:ATP-binding cassette domain-containing protein [Methanosarcina sp. Z-7115]|uniref:ATP-binding cassette domain-containing protein n=1 Tax=Methanosarcina baikalica TaxID=3073890 RepID=A0ABU2D4Z8_9EURY|nr:ATP-binding cassette domain-containing protein [Methanosarcina sp. Z-7115]MDR7667048.1 ATP-binding cassette domain-containing protein [Methanosarcina sp. Z-7115]